MAAVVPADHGRSARAAPLWRRQPTAREALLLGLFCALVSALPVLVAPLPQMGDYPAHVARWRVMLDLGHDPWLARYYAFKWRWSGNLGFDLLIRPLAPLLGLENAGRVLVALLAPLTGFGVLSVEWVLRRRIGVGSLLALAFIWSPALLMGFVNFCLSLAVALLAFALWVRTEDKPWRQLLFLPIGLIVWLCHVSGWGILGILCFGYELHQRRNVFSAALACVPLALPLAPMLLGGGTKGQLSYGLFVSLYKQAIWTRAMRDEVFLLDSLSLALVIILLGAALLTKRMDGRLGWAALILLVGSFVVPRKIFGGDYADYRLIASGLMVACMAVDWRAPRWALWLAPALYLGRLAVTTIGWADHAHEAKELLGALDHLPQGAKVANVVVMERRKWSFDRMDHLAAYAVVRKSALTNVNFAVPTIHMLQVREGGPRFIDPSQRMFHSRGQKIDLSAFPPSADADWLWYIGDQPPDKLPTGAQVVWRAPHGLLARLANGAGRV